MSITFIVRNSRDYYTRRSVQPNSEFSKSLHMILIGKIGTSDYKLLCELRCIPVDLSIAIYVQHAIYM